MTIDELIAELTRIDDDARALVAPLGDAQANWKPEEGRRWSVAQNLQHLARTNGLYVHAMRRGLAGAGQGSAAQDLLTIPGRLGRWFIGVMEPPPRFRVRTRPFAQPPATAVAREALAQFLEAQEALRTFAREAASRDLGARFRSPFGPLRFRIGTGLLVAAAHDRRHLWQARQVTAAPGFPAGAPRA